MDSSPSRFGLILLLAALALLSPLTISGAAQADPVSKTVPFKVLGGDECFMLANVAFGHNPPYGDFSAVIRDEASLRKIFDPMNLRQSCEGRNPATLVPKVDFNTRNVLAFWNAGSCAATGFARHVQRDDAARKIIYSIAVTEAAIGCSGPGLEGMNLIEIPLVPTGYDVVFEKVSD